MIDLQAFEDWLVDQNKAAKTIRNSLGDLRRIQQAGEIRTRDDIRLWIRHNRLNGMLNVTLNHYLRTINLVCEMLKWEKFPYAREVKNMKIKTVTEEERDRIFSSFRGYEGKRDKAIAALIFGCGLRIGEAWNIQLQDFAGDVLRVRGKNEKVRDVWIPPEVQKALDEYRKTRLPTDENYLFTSRNGRMKYEYFRQRMSRVAARSGVRFHNHMARHTFATKLLKDGVSIVSVSKLLGHASVKETAVYEHLDVQDAFKEVKRTRKGPFFLAEVVK